MTVSTNEQVIADEQARHWRKRKLKFVSSVRTSNVDKHIVEGEAAVRLCNYTDVYYHENMTADMPFMQGSATESEIERFGLRKGQVLLTKDSESWEDIAVPAYVAETTPEVVCGYHLAVIEPNSDEVDGQFLSWLAQSPVLNDQFKLSAKGVTRFGLSQHALKNAVIEIPPLEYQLKVATFLDRKTAEIDTLIAKKRRLLDRLAEKRTALITHAVTKGLNPDAPMKDSGIEWLGEIPAHWGLPTISRITESIQTGPFGSQLHASDYVQSGIPVINPAHIISGSIAPDSRSCVDADTADRLSRHRLREGDIIMGRRGEIGRSAVVRKKEAGYLCGTGSLTIRLDGEDPLYFNRVFSSSGFRALLELEAVGTTMLNLNPAIVGRQIVPKPPLDEQQMVVRYLDEEEGQFLRVSNKIKAAISKLTEYRSALITNAVTGQIKVA